MVKVIVRNKQKQESKELSVTDAGDLNDTVRRSRFFGDGTLEDEYENIIGGDHPLAENATYLWYPLPGSVPPPAPGPNNDLLQQLTMKMERMEAEQAAMKAQQTLDSKLRRMTITDAQAVGRHMLQMVKVDMKAVTEILTGPVAEDVICNLASVLSNKHGQSYRAARTSSFEEPTQKMYTEVLSEMATNLESSLHMRDTHSKDYPVNPTGKIDITWTRSSSTDRVLWSDVASFCEVKPSIRNSTMHMEGLGQLADCAQTLLDLQPTRSLCVGVLAGAGELEVLVWHRHKPTILSTGVQEFSFQPGSVGLQLVARLVASSSEQLGFRTPYLPDRLEATTEASSSLKGKICDVTCQAVLQDCMPEKGSQVYSCVCQPREVDARELKAVLKIGHKCIKEAQILEHVHGIPGVPELVARGYMSSGQPFMITAPLGQTLSADSGPNQLLQSIRAIACTVRDLYQQEVMQLDVSAPNIVVDPVSQTTYLIDYHIAEHLSQVPAEQSCNRLFASITRLERQLPTLSGELESLLYTLTYWACDGAVPWKHASTHTSVAAMKLYTMTRGFEAKVLVHCKANLAPAVRRLRDLFFSPEYREDVSVDDFVGVCDTLIQELQ